jgi:hypothetical protein
MNIVSILKNKKYEIKGVKGTNLKIRMLLRASCLTEGKAANCQPVLEPVSCMTVHGARLSQFDCQKGRAGLHTV